MAFQWKQRYFRITWLRLYLNNDLFSLFLNYRGFSWGNLVGRWEQPRDASAVPSVSGRHAPYQHKLPHTWEDGADPAGLPVPPGGPGHVQPLWAGKAWQEAVRPAHDLWNSLWVFSSQGDQHQQDLIINREFLVICPVLSYMLQNIYSHMSPRL